MTPSTLAAEMAAYRGYGHSTVEQACAFADAAGVGRLLLAHHAPARTDDELDGLSATRRATPGGIPITVAREGERLAI